MTLGFDPCTLTPIFRVDAGGEMKTNFQRAKLMLDAMMPAVPGDGPSAVKAKIVALARQYPGNLEFRDRTDRLF